MGMSKRLLFIEKAKPNKLGVSRWVYDSEFVGKYERLQIRHGLDWGRRDSLLARTYNVEKKRAKKGNKIIAVRLNGFYKKSDKYHSNYVKPSIRAFHKGKPSVFSGVGASGSVMMELDHKDGRKNDPRVMNVETQENSDFQNVTKAENDAKRQHCINCKNSGIRFDAKRLGYSSAYVYGTEFWTPMLRCKGCYWYDPIEFNSSFSIFEL